MNVHFRGVKNIDNVDSNMELHTLRDELDRVNTEFMKANEERAKAAEYGLVLLEEKQQLQYKNEELTSLYERTKQELETSTMTLRQVQRDYEKRVKRVERQREALIEEMEGREKELLSRVENLEEDRRGLERRLKKTSSEHEFLSENNAIISSENERLKQEIIVQKEELRQMKREDVTSQNDNEQLRKELEQSRQKLEKLRQYEQSLEDLSEQNLSLRNDLTILQDHCESIVSERDDLEKQTKEIVQTLNEEREAKSLLENKMRDNILRSPDRVNWLTESVSNLAVHPNQLVRDLVMESHIPSSISAPTSPIPSEDIHVQTHSTPFGTKPSLFSELQSLQSDDSKSPQDTLLDSLQLKLQDAETRIEKLEKEKLQLIAKLNHSNQLSTEVEKWKTRYQQAKEGRDTDLDSLKDELAAKKEIVGQLKSKLSIVNREKATSEIELEGVKEEIGRIKETSRLEMEKLEKEVVEEQTRNGDLRGRIVELEEKLSQTVNCSERLETILVNSTGELDSVKAEILNFHKALTSLQSENKFTSPSHIQENSTPSSGDEEDTYNLSVHEGKKKLKIYKDNQTVLEVTQLRDLLRQLRGPLELFTRKMLESSLATSSQHMLTGLNHTEDIAREGKPDDDSLQRKINELEGNNNKLRARLANRTEEVNQLRTIMRARQTTVDVTISSLKSKLEGQMRSHETEVNQLKHKIKTLRKERDDQTSLGALTSRRCQEYIEEISKVKKRVEELRGERDQLCSENKLLSVYLERAIKQKLDISQQLERYHEEEERTKIIPLTLSASRV